MIIDIVLVKAVGRGGLEAVITTVANELVARGYRIRVFQSDPPEYIEWADTLPEIYYYNPELLGLDHELWRESSLLDQASIGYSTLVKRLGAPDIVLATHTPALSYICWKAYKDAEGELLRPPIISWLHGPPDAYGGDGAPQLQLADAHVVISTTIGKKISSVSKNKPIFYVGNPLPTTNVEMVSRPQKPFKLLYIGRLMNGQKRLDLMFQALCRLKGDWELTIIGDGPDDQILKKLAINLGIDQKVIWKGWKSDPWAHTEEASLLLLTSDYEGFGMVLTEALARGIPVLSTETDGPGDIIIHGVNGWLVTIGDYVSIRRTIQQIMDGSLNLPDFEICKRVASQFDLVKIVNRFEEAFETVLLHDKFQNEESKSLQPTLIKLLQNTISDEPASLDEAALIDTSDLGSIKRLMLDWIDSGELKRADIFLKKYSEILEPDMELISIAVYLYNEFGYVEQAKACLVDAYNIEPTYADNLYSLAVLLDQDNFHERALFFYWQALFFCTDKNMEIDIKGHIQSLILRIN